MDIFLQLLFGYTSFHLTCLNSLSMDIQPLSETELILQLEGRMNINKKYKMQFGLFTSRIIRGQGWMYGRERHKGRDNGVTRCPLLPGRWPEQGLCPQTLCCAC